MKQVFVLFSICILLLASETIFAQTGSDYYLPLSVGSHVTLSTVGGTGSNWAARTTTYTIEGTDLISGQQYFRAVYREMGSSWSDVFQVLWVRKDSAGDVAVGAVGVGTPGHVLHNVSTNIDSATVMSGYLFPNGFLTKGYSISYSPGKGVTGQETVLSVTETVSVPAGTFYNCIKISDTHADNTGTLIYCEYDYYARGIGLVKVERTLPISDIHTDELIEYGKTGIKIPNGGFEDWTGNNLDGGWVHCNAITKSTDHYPIAVGNYSIRLENNIALLPQCDASGFAVTAPYLGYNGPAFPITGHPTSFCGYYKFLPQNHDTMTISLALYKNGVIVANSNLKVTATVANWTSFNIPISPYTTADSAQVGLCAFNYTWGIAPAGPYGNSILYVDNLSFDNLITSVSQSYSQSLIGIWDKVSGPGNPIRYTFQTDSKAFIQSQIQSQTKIDTVNYSTFSIPSSDLRGIDLGRGGVVSWRGIYKMSSDSLVLQIEGYWYTGLPPTPTPTSFSTPTTYAKVTTTKDIFPLSVGYTWRYNFTYVLTFSDVHKRTTDAGKLVLEVTGMISTPDSVRWQFTQWRDFVESYYDDPSIKNIKDTTSFELVEMMKDQHQLYKPNYDMNGIFPFKKTTIDSAKIYRYTTQNGIYTRKIYLFGNPSIYPGESDNHDITFSADTGVVRSEAVFYELDTYSTADFNLQSFHTFYSDVHLKPGLPTEYLLSQNYPNPFNPATTIEFSIPRTSFVNLEVFNMLGQKIKTLINEKKLPGNYQVKFDCRNLASGIYFYRMQTENFIETKKLILIK